MSEVDGGGKRLNNGKVPLDVLQDLVEEYIQTKKK